MNIEFGSTGQLLFRVPGYCLITSSESSSLSMSVDYMQVLQSVSCSRKTQYLISILHDTAYFPHFFYVNQVYFHKRNPSTRSYSSSFNIYIDMLEQATKLT